MVVSVGDAWADEGGVEDRSDGWLEGHGSGSPADLPSRARQALDRYRQETPRPGRSMHTRTKKHSGSSASRRPLIEVLLSEGHTETEDELA